MTHLSIVTGLFGVLGLIKLTAIAFLPETSDGEIPDTIEEAKVAYGKKSNPIQSS